MPKNPHNEHPWHIRAMTASEAEAAAVSRLVLDLFTEFIAGDYTADGIAEIREYVLPSELLRRMRGNWFILVAVAGQDIVGMVEVEADDHITLLFVDGEYHGRGVARALVKTAVERSGTPLTVHASRYAVPFYRKLGFTPEGPEQTRNGRVFRPMVLE